ncbi:NAD-dependent epimerase/dehydratase family protein [Gilvimarinus xylanilyticus]|uniref:NAD-dependent epimerase/dehydratase family protein n=1 Tax=Gilvimarinus xylanilyticus TaxID=2944139 RepID=A0A9X2HVE3_9GAMM|nr:NAD-dependent epimerase/dehydratase family protein [Gilvimarinus xylanilyticus]MCP8898369.1 NAD-dependent epimerase/dehydratase family protein [Gilvimarinus xylanilyticus]
MHSEAPQVFVSGVTGFVGGHIYRYLSGRGLKVAGSGRSSGQTHDAWVALDEHSDLSEFKQALAGVEWLVHAAGKAHVFSAEANRDETFYPGNILFTQKLMRAACEVGVKAIVHISSVSVYAAGKTSFIDSTMAVQPDSAYGSSKLKAETAAEQICRSLSVPLVTLRLPLVYGANPKGNMQRLLGLVDSGFPLPLGGVRNARSLLSINNLSHFIARLIGTPEIVSGTFVLADAERLSTPEIIKALAMGMGRPYRVFPFPLTLLSALARLAGRKQALDKLCGSLIVDAGDLYRTFDWLPPFNTKNELIEMARGFAMERKG